jgi:hypothetical protein
MAFRHCLVQASRPDFAVGKDGLLLREGRVQNHYVWDDVRYCNWSHYEPGVLNIQVGAHLAWSGVSAPPTRLFHPIPVAYQAQVEKTIRTMGKWAGGESDGDLVPAASWGSDWSELNSTILNPFDGTQQALVEIPYPRRKLVDSLFPALLSSCFGAICRLEGVPMPARLFFPILFGSMAVVIVASTLYGASFPAFAVFKEGIWLRFSRSSTWSFPSKLDPGGLFPWDEVSYCRWSRYALGMLIIQSTGRQTPNKPRLPPTRLEYRVSEEYRPSVETAIRAMGKWAE